VEVCAVPRRAVKGAVAAMSGTPGTRAGGRAAPLVLAAAAFLVSGASGLVYQVAWQRILALMSGVGIYSIAMIVAAFMAGLGAGSHLGGRWSERLPPRRALLAFALAELGIGAFGAASCWIYYDVLYGRAPGLYASPWSAARHALRASLARCRRPDGHLARVPGARAMVGRPTTGRTIGVLYGINLLGAAAGALLTPWVLIRLYGVRGAVLWAAAGNALAGLVALALFAVFRARTGSAAPDPEPASAERTGPTQAFGLWMALYALSGFCALSLEILWFRVLDVAVKATAFTFGTMLALYLLGSAVGCLAGAPFVSRLRRPLRTFLLCQCVLLAYAGVAFVLLVALPADGAALDWYWTYWQKPGSFHLGAAWDWDALRRLYLWLPLALYGPPTILMGFAFPVLQRAVQDDPRTSGRKVGLLQAANILGCMAGSLAVGLLALAWLGTTGTLRLLMIAGAGFAAVGIRRFGPRTPFAPLLAGLLALAVAMPSQRSLWLRVHGAVAPESLVEEDATGVAAILPGKDRPWRVFVSGKSHSWLPFGGIHSSLGAAPAVVHPAPVDVAIIGLGSADTAWAAGCREETRSVTVFEISGPQPRLLRALGAREPLLPDLSRFLADPRVRVVVADGRNALARDDRRYGDVIEADAQWPDVARRQPLLGRVFAQCARRLKPGGVVCTPPHAPRLRRVHALPAARGRGDVLIGSNEPIAYEPDAWRARLSLPAVASYLGPGAVADAEHLLKQFHPRNLKGRVHPARQTNFDLFPRDEFLAPTRK
jgi:predicted membrane-bound spermidine synthase